MIDVEKLKPVLEGYKAYFPKHWQNEKYKWEAVKHFQDHWDIDAKDFAKMLKSSLDKTFNLLASGFAYPKAMVEHFAEADPERTRQMFQNLFDEKKDLAERIETFQQESDAVRSLYDDGTWKNHYQNLNAISVYLWLRYPDKYYIYKYELALAVSKELNSSFKPRKNGKVDNVIHGYSMYEEIQKEIRKDEALCKMVSLTLTDDCYADLNYKTTTIDVCFYLTRFYLDEKKAKPPKENWFPADYTPGLTKEQWRELIGDEKVFTMESLQIMKRMLDYGGQATCKELAAKYGKGAGFYIGTSAELARRIVKKTGCPVLEKDTENSKWWPILYLGKRADVQTEGNYMWKLRPELREALEQADLSQVSLYEEPPKEKERGYWWLTANPHVWSFSDIKVGEEQNYTLYNENGNKRRVFQNFLNAKEGDCIIGYEANPVKKVVALGRITRSNDGEAIYFEKTEGLSAPIDYAALRECPELAQMEFFGNPNGSLFKLTKDEYVFMMDRIREDNPIPKAEKDAEIYRKQDFLNEVFMTPERYDVLEGLLKNKLNVILQGAPGVGKTFAAKRLCYAMMGEKDDTRIKMIQFHQSYSYEDFIMGYRPDGEGFKLTPGIFYEFCRKADNDRAHAYFLIIDEINRGNLSKILGETMMLIEKGYRDTQAVLAYSGQNFFVPGNLYIIGMMNTADRSLAMIDYALRRRFSFFDMEPGFSSEGFENYRKALHNETFDALMEQMKALNREIAQDRSLGSGFQIGHSYFCEHPEGEDLSAWLRSVVEFDILPTMREYWFDDPKMLDRWEKNLRGVFDDE